MSGDFRTYPLMTLRQRLLGFVGGPLVVWAPFYALLGFAEPIRALECRRERAGDPVACVETSAAWGRAPVRTEFVLDDATLALERVASRRNRGVSSRAFVHITPAGREPLVLDYGGARLEARLRAMLGDPAPTSVRDGQDWRPFMWTMLPLLALILTGPMLAFGGRLHVRITGEHVEFTRSRAGFRGQTHRVPIVGGHLPRIAVRQLRYRRSVRSSLIARSGGHETEVVGAAPPAVLTAIAADLDAALAAASRSAERASTAR